MKKKSIILLIIASILVVATGCITVNLGSTSEKETSKIEKKTTDEKNNSSEKEENKSNKNDNSKITIVIDPGHSSTGTSGNEPVSPNSSTTKLKDGLGATGEFTNIPEHKTNMSVALLLKEDLISRGYNVVLTKESVSESKSNIERADPSLNTTR